MNGGTLSSNDYFIGRERKRRREALSKIQAKKTRVDEYNRLATRAAKLMEERRIADNGITNDVRVPELKELVRWKMYYSKSFKLPSRRAELVDMWNKHDLPAQEEVWTPQDEAELDRLQQDDIQIAETALGMEHSRNTAAIIGGLASASMPKKDIVALEVALNNLKQSRTTNLQTMDAPNEDDGV